MAGVEEAEDMTEVEDMTGIEVMKGIMTGMKKDVNSRLLQFPGSLQS